MSMDLVALGWRFLLTNPRAVMLFVWIGVGGCLGSISSTVTHTGMVWREFMKKAPISASAMEDMPFLYDIVNI